VTLQDVTGDYFSSDQAERIRSRSLWSVALRRLSRNRAAVAGAVFIVLLAVVAIGAPLFARYHFADQHLLHTYESPNSQFWFGSDELGRDIYSRVIYGARISLGVALAAMVFQLAIGVPLGLIAGFYGRWVDSLVMRLVDMMLALPTFLLLIVFANYFRETLTTDASGLAGVLSELNDSIAGLLGVLLAISLTWWVFPARLVRGVVLSLRERDFVTAARASGATGRRIIIIHILPNTMAPIVVAAMLGIPGAILAEAGISFLGLGVQPPYPSWGLMIADAATALRSYPYMIIPPSAALVLTTLAFNFLGDGLRDALDPSSGTRK
jgi:ABC-type dipeptide/oligopeptide/nickel transport system permease subunit